MTFQEYVREGRKICPHNSYITIRVEYQYSSEYVNHAGKLQYEIYDSKAEGVSFFRGETAAESLNKYRDFWDSDTALQNKLIPVGEIDECIG